MYSRNFQLSNFNNNINYLVKILHQWYWSVEYSDYTTDSGDSIDFDSYMIPESDLELGQFRLLDVDNRIIIPVDCHIRFIVTGKTILPLLY